MIDTYTSIQTWRYYAGSGIAAVALSANGDTVVAGTLGKTVVGLDSQGQQRWQVKVGNQAWRVGLSADGQTTVVGIGSTRPWDMKGRGLYCLAMDGSLRWQVELNASVWGLDLSADGQTVAVGTDKKQLICFDGRGQRLWQQDIPGLGWGGWVFGAALSADGQTIAAAAADKQVRLLERSGLVVAEFRTRGELYIVAVSANGQVVATGDTKGYVYLLDRQGQLLWEERLADKVWAIGLSTDGQRLLVGAGEKEKHLHAYDQSGRLLWRRFVEGGVNDVALSANGQRVVAGTRSGGIYIFGEDGEVLHQAQAGKLVRQVAISATGERIVIGSEDGYIYGFQLPPSLAVASTSVPQAELQPIGTVYNIHINHATGLAIGDKAQVTQSSTAETRLDNQPSDASSQRCFDLAENIQETLALIKRYEEQRRLSSDPKEQRRAEREITDLRAQLSAYQAEARKLGCDVTAGTEKTDTESTDFDGISSAISNSTEHLERQLPIPTYSRLFGVDNYVDQLLNKLQDRQRDQIISIQGIGGIGKTALADYVVRAFIRRVDHLSGVAWISAKQEYLTGSGIVESQTRVSLEAIFDELGQKLALKDVLRLPLAQKIERLASILRAEPYLLVIDNLETVDDFQKLVPWLEKLAMPTKFLLTSREDIVSLTSVSRTRLKELDQEASLALIQYNAQEKELDDIDAQSVYNLVGGNPQAIILLVSQMQYLPPVTVLKNVRLGTTDDIYKYVYWKSWSALTTEAREILLAIQRAGDQADWDWLSTMSDLSSGKLQGGIQQLINLSLVQPQRGPANERYFAIHRLTSTFLRTEVLGWK